MLKRTKIFLSVLFTFCMTVNVSIAHAEDEKYYDATTFDPTTISLTAASSNIAYGAGVPVGTVVAWPHVDLPSGATQSVCTASVSSSDALAHGCEWLICDGSTINGTAYSALAAIVGATLPNLKGRFLEGANGVVGETKEAGLPNIEGTWIVGRFAGWSGPNGAVKIVGTGSAGDVYGDKRTYYDRLQINASLANPVYGKSTTVQPASYTVNYLIKAY